MDTHSPQVARQGGARPLGASGSDPPQPVVVPQRSWDSVVSPSLAHIVLPYGRGRAAGSLDSRASWNLGRLRSRSADGIEAEGPAAVSVSQLTAASGAKCPPSPGTAAPQARG